MHQQIGAKLGSGHEAPHPADQTRAVSKSCLLASRTLSCVNLKGLCPLQVNPTQAEGFSHIQMQGTGILLSQSCSSPQ